MITRFLKALERLEDGPVSDFLGIVFLAAIIPLVLLLGEVLS